MNEHLDHYLRREFPEHAVAVERTTEQWGRETLKVQSTEIAILLLGESGISDEGAEYMYNFLDSAASRFCREGTPVRLLSGYTPVPPHAFELSSAGDTIRMVPSLLGCIRHPRQSLGEDIFDLRTTLMLDKSDRPANEQKMADLRTKIQEQRMKATRKRRKAS